MPQNKLTFQQNSCPGRDAASTGLHLMEYRSGPDFPDPAEKAVGCFLGAPEPADCRAARGGFIASFSRWRSTK